MDSSVSYAENLFHINHTASNPADHIRLLRPARLSGHGNSWQLKVFSLRKAPQFAALSYSWGARPSTSSLYIQTGKTIGHFSISDDLSNCLVRLRRANYHEWLWIDALCINQASNEEKSDQVAMMKSIYGRASRIFVWLGEYNNDTSPWQLSASSLPMRNYVARLNKVGISQAKLHELIHGGDFIWWRRLWVIQEVASAGYVDVCVGSTITPWGDFAAVFVDTWEEMSALDAKDLLLLKSAMEDFDKVRTLRKNLRESADGESLVELLKQTSPKGVSRPEDRVYALLGIATREYRTGIPVYYGSSILEIFSGVIKVIVEQTGSLDVLFEGWPRGHGDGVGHTSMLGLEDSTTTGKTTHGQNSQLNLPTWMPNLLEPFDHNRGPWFRSIGDMVDLSRSTRPDIRAIRGVLNMTAVPCDVVVDACDLDASLACSSCKNNVKYVRYVSADYYSNSCIPHLTKHAPRMQDVTLGPIRLVQTPSTLQNLLCSSWCRMEGATFNWFVTDQGVFGVADAPLCYGDEILMPFGSRYPIAIRRSILDNHESYEHTLVGACYMPGVTECKPMSLYSEGTKTYRLG